MPLHGDDMQAAGRPHPPTQVVRWEPHRYDPQAHAERLLRAGPEGPPRPPSAPRPAYASRPGFSPGQPRPPLALSAGPRRPALPAPPDAGYAPPIPRYATADERPGRLIARAALMLAAVTALSFVIAIIVISAIATHRHQAHADGGLRPASLSQPAAAAGLR